ncbi:MepB family protein [Candidatus Dependentiae bacterium]|nr:MepB family protein [Candidatus Dependentiae bacterium]
MPSDLLGAQEVAYLPCGLFLKNFEREQESQEYDASRFKINDKIIQFRSAKITPTKIGQFVTFWKRIGNGPIIPFDLADPVDIFVVSVRFGELLGQFAFPKTVLHQKGFIAKKGIGGKRAMRVYPPWDHVESKQAKATQSWQLQFFFEVRPNPNTIKIRELFC